MRHAEMGIANLKEKVDTLVIIPNEKLLKMADKKTTLLESFKLADDILRQGVQAISDLITITGMINADFADIKTVMRDKGLAHMGVGIARGENRADMAVKDAISSPLLETSIDGATGVILNFTGGPEMGAMEVYEAADVVKEAADPDANIIFGAVIDESLGEDIRITVIATGFENEENSIISEAKNIKSTVTKQSSNNSTTKEQVEPVKEVQVEEKEEIKIAPAVEEDDEYLDIPPFLRRNKR